MSKNVYWMFINKKLINLDEYAILHSYLMLAKILVNSPEIK